jgi:hexosaminidase
MKDINTILIPAPRSVRLREGALALSDITRVSLEIPAEWRFPAMQTVEKAIGPSAVLAQNDPSAAMHIAKDENLPPDGFVLSVTDQGVTLRGNSRAGLYYGAQAFGQLFRAARDANEPLPACHIQDSPDFPVRGVMLDISRDKVPTLATLFHLVDIFAHLRYNQLQLYMEHTFAYEQHAQVWLNASPLTPDDIHALDAYCRLHCIELVPNQNSFGHLERWLKYEEYLPLAELPQGGAPLPWGGTRDYPSAVSPEEPATIPFLESLYDELLPNFSSRLFNVGCDETFDLRGEGKSAARVKREGEGAVYLDFIKRIHKLLEARGRRMMFWGDIILQHPECVPGLPKDAIALDWGYEGEHPFEAQCKLFAKAGIPFYVCPGTSAWRSLAGRTDNMLENIRAAAKAGRANGAAGFMVCDWGDGGHWQPLCVSHAGFVEGALVSWCAAANSERDLAAVMEQVCIAPGYGRALLDMGNLYQFCGTTCPNASELFKLLSEPFEAPVAKGVTHATLLDVLKRLEGILLKLPLKPPTQNDAFIAQHQEVVLVSRLIRTACLRGIARLGELSDGTGRQLQDDLANLRRLYEQTWLIRNRIGGLRESLRLFPER